MRIEKVVEHGTLSFLVPRRPSAFSDQVMDVAEASDQASSSADLRGSPGEPPIAPCLGPYAQLETGHLIQGIGITHDSQPGRAHYV